MNKFAEVTINTYNKMIPILASKHTNGSFQVGLSFDFVKKPKFIWSLSIPLKIYRIIGCYFFMIKMLLIISSNYNKFAKITISYFVLEEPSPTQKKENKGKKKKKKKKERQVSKVIMIYACFRTYIYILIYLSLSKLHTYISFSLSSFSFWFQNMSILRIYFLRHL